MKIYHMIIAMEAVERFGDKSTRKEYMSKRQGSAPQGYICLGVCGYHETPKEENPLSSDRDKG